MDKISTLVCFFMFCIDISITCSQLCQLVGNLESEIPTKLIPKIKYLYNEINRPSDYPVQYDPKPGEEFDFIIVGAGSAGSVVANRLTEVGKWKVLLLEAGGNPPKESEAPALAGSLQRTNVDWQYRTDPDEHNCLSQVNCSCRWPRGKVLGGSSVLNYMLYVRGNAEDFDTWAKEGNYGWAYKDVLPYFKKSEGLRDPRVLRTKDALKYHGIHGCLTVEGWENSGNNLMEIFRKGYRELGYAFNPDYNGRTQKGFAPTVGTLRDHRRCSTAKAFLTSAKDRPNLKVSRRSLATKVLVDADTSRAIGVEFMNRFGNKIKVFAKKEVVLSAGTINTPQLLMLSGIGPKQHLRKLGIPVIQDLPVGKELHDHPGPAINIFTFENSPLHCLNTTVNKTVQSTFNFLLRRKKSSLSFQNGYESILFLNVFNKYDIPNMKILYLYFNKNDKDGILSVFKGLNYNDEIVDQFVSINRNHFTVVMFPAFVTPFSRGRITLKNSNPRTYPRIQSGYLTDKRDTQALIRSIKFLYRLADTQEFKNMGAKIHEIRVAACGKYKFRSNKYRECALHHLVTTNGHQCCTSGMGRVVDPRLRVKGVSRLRVIDASAMPNITRGNINAPVIMIAEKGSDLIKQSWLANRDCA